MQLLRDQGLPLVLLNLVVLFSVLTLTEQPTQGARAADAVVELMPPPPARVVIFSVKSPDDAVFAERLRQTLAAKDYTILDTVAGAPSDGAAWLKTHTADVVAVSSTAAGWTFLADVPNVVKPPPTLWPTFLLADNLQNILSQIAIIALVAVGMTLVIATGGIDLSVGGVMAFAAILAALLIRESGGVAASTPVVIVCCAAALLACAGLGLTTGVLITMFRVPPFIATLGMMWIARGLAFDRANNQSINDLPPEFGWLGGGSSLGLPNIVWLDALFYLAAFVLVRHTVLGRHILAVGSNPRAALLSGVPVKRTLIFVYVASAVLAGLGGIVLASQLRTADPKTAPMYELYVITAVVVGGTSLRGGQGRILGTLQGALLISIVQIGMNLLQINPQRQMIVLGCVLLVAVLADLRQARG